MVVRAVDDRGTVMDTSVVLPKVAAAVADAAAGAAASAPVPAAA
jgi:hypothetical protein